MSTISVVIATYGEQEWAALAEERAVPSVETQGDDYDWLSTYHTESRGIAWARNRGAEGCTTDWLIFLDADDELAPGYILAMRRALEQNADDSRVLFTPAVQQIRKGRPGRPFFFPECDFRTGNWLVIGTMISRSLFDEIGGFREHPHGLEDWNLWARCVRAGARVVKVKDAVYRAHMNPRSKHHVLSRDRPAYMAAYEAARVDAWG